MSDTYQDHHRRTVAACLLGGLLLAHVLFRYLFAALFGYVTYRGLAPMIPFIALGLYMLLLVTIAVGAVVRYRRAGLLIGAGLLVLALEPLGSAMLWGDGCEVGGGGKSLLLPKVTIADLRIVVYAWNGSCGASLTPQVIGPGLGLVVVGFRRARVPARVLDRWLALVERCWPAGEA
jgi:hypothetical protein